MLIVVEIVVLVVYTKVPFRRAPVLPASAYRADACLGQSRGGHEYGLHNLQGFDVYSFVCEKVWTLILTSTLEWRIIVSYSHSVSLPMGSKSGSHPKKKVQAPPTTKSVFTKKKKKSYCFGSSDENQDVWSQINFDPHTNHNSSIHKHTPARASACTHEHCCLARQVYESEYSQKRMGSCMSGSCLSRQPIESLSKKSIRIIPHSHTPLRHFASLSLLQNQRHA